MTMPVPRPIFHFLVSATTQLILIVGALLILLPTGILFQLPWSMLSALFIYNIIVATLVAVVLTNHSLQNKPAVVKGAGLVLGHLVGLVLGGFLGSKYGGPVWALVGAAVLYFVVGWVGSKVSVAAGTGLEKLASPPWESDADKLIRTSAARRNRLSWCVYGAAVPAVFLAAAMFVKIAGWPIGQYAHVLPTARIVIAPLSLLSILIPWLRRTRWMHRANSTLAHGTTIALVGVTLSLAPAVYGFLLFVAFGLSITELVLFALAASIATATWGARTARS